MAHYRATTGSHLARMLQADGWRVEWERANKIHLSKDGFHDIGFSLRHPIPTKYVKTICKRAEVTASRFEELFLTTPFTAVAKGSGAIN